MSKPVNEKIECRIYDQMKDETGKIVSVYTPHTFESVRHAAAWIYEQRKALPILDKYGNALEVRRYTRDLAILIQKPDILYTVLMFNSATVANRVIRSMFNNGTVHNNIPRRKKSA